MSKERSPPAPLSRTTGTRLDISLLVGDGLGEIDGGDDDGDDDWALTFVKMSVSVVNAFLFLEERRGEAA